MKRDLFQHLMVREKYFVEEISRLCLGPSTIQSFFSGQNQGWLYLSGEEGSADWNLARLIGTPEAGLEMLARLPAKDLQLLVPENEQSLFPDWKKNETLIWLAAESENPAAVPETSPLSQKFEMKFRNCRRKGLFFEVYAPEIYLLNDGQIVGLVKTIRETPSFIEVYIEVAPANREQGLGANLLYQMIVVCQKIGKTLTYVVSQENHASLALARKLGLVEFNRLSRLSRSE